jgi:hypothetical protein
LLRVPLAEDQALSRSYGRCFAEFLNDGSLVHLGTFMPTHLCRFAVRIPYVIALEAFLGTSDSRIASLSADFRRALEFRIRICLDTFLRPRDDYSQKIARDGEMRPPIDT